MEYIELVSVQIQVRSDLKRHTAKIFGNEISIVSGCTKCSLDGNE